MDDLIASTNRNEESNDTKKRLVAAGGITGALAASACCIIPVVLFSFGVSGAWISNLTALDPYKPIFIAFTFGMLGYGFWLVYLKPGRCNETDTCRHPLPNRLVKGALWAALALVLLALFWPWLAPVIVPFLLSY
ncbi:mercuric transporter MerT family protein [Pseudovibrio ascidiaceicola]|uniref:mercuric transporter MerT family protein n=1 Tax=Pseudovibrio ascidiaceicola TaxID=285279 RepID=UPI003D36D69B